MLTKLRPIIMLRGLLLMVSVALSATLFAQNVSLTGKLTKLTPADMCDGGGVVSVPHTETHVYKKKLLDASKPATGIGRIVSAIPLGSSGNLFTIIDGRMNNVSADEALNTVVFIHRADPSIFTNDNVGQYRYDISKDGGKSFVNNLGVLNPTGNQLTQAARYPQVAIFNPPFNTNPDLAYLTYLGPWLPFDNNGGWDGYWAGVARLDDSKATYTENSLAPNNSDTYIVAGLSRGALNEFWAVDYDAVDQGAGQDFAFEGILVNKGVWDFTDQDIDWTVNTILTPSFDLSFDGSAQLTNTTLAFDPTGQYGWIAFSADIEAGGTNSFDIHFYRTQNGGNTWTGPISLDLKSFKILNDKLLDPTLEPTSAFEADLVVDAYGNPHFCVVVGTDAGDYAIATGATGGTETGLNLYDFTYIPSADPGYEWHAIFLDTISNMRGTIAGAISSDNRPQASTSPDGTTVFFGWSESDPALTNANDLPNFLTRSINLTGNYLASPVQNWTNDPGDVFSAGALFPSVAPTCLIAGSTYELPVVFTRVNPSGSEEDPASFFYIENITFPTNVYTTDIIPPIINLNGSNPLTIVVGGTYNEPGAVANDNVDGNITPQIQISGSVNTAVAGSYSVVYSVTDAAGNEANPVTRTVNVVSVPDNTPPVITLTGANSITLDVCDFFAEPGFSASDNIDGNLTNQVVADYSNVVFDTPGSYSITYDVCDGAGNCANQLTRTINVVDNAPTINLVGPATVNVESFDPAFCSDAFIDEGAIAYDGLCGPLSVTIGGQTPNYLNFGTYVVTYTADDGVNAPVSINRNIIVVADATDPEVTINGADTVYSYLGDNFSDPGATAFDCHDGNITNVSSNASSAVNETARGTYTVTYTATDMAGNSGTVNRDVIVGTEPDPNFTELINGLSVSLTDQSLYGPSAWEWDFGNGLGSSNKNATATFAQEGTYTVCLEARNLFNQAPFSKPAKQFCKDISVFVGVEDIALDRAIELFPNPSKGQFVLNFGNISSGDVTVEVRNTLGSVMLSQSFENVAGTRQTFDVSTLPGAVYFVHIITDKAQTVKEVTVIK